MTDSPIEARRTFGIFMLVVLLATLLYAIDPAFFVKDDFQLQYLPGSREVARAWTSGEMPLLSRFSWVCAALGAEYQFGIFSIFRTLLDLLVWALPLTLTGRGATLFVVHAAIAAAGGYRLARSYGATPGAATMTGLVAGLNGWTLWWATTWYPAIASFAWLPWYWLALRGIASERSRWSWAGAAFSLYLLITAGWPYSVAMAVAVAAMNVLSGLARRRWQVAFTMSGASLLGVGLAAPAVLMLLEYFPYTARTAAAMKFEFAWLVPGTALFGLIVPAFSVVWPGFARSAEHPAVELLGAFVPLAAITAAFGRRLLRERLPEVVLLCALLLVLLMPSAGPFRWSFRWLPLFHLALAVVGAASFERSRRRIPLCGLGLAAVAAAASFVLDHDVATTLLHAGVIGAACVLWAMLEARGSRVAGAMPAVITAGMIVLTFVSFLRLSEVPRWPYEQTLLAASPFEPSRRYLALYQLEQVFMNDPPRGIDSVLRPGSIPMLAGVEFINGYSPLGLASLKNVFRLDPHGPVDDPRSAQNILRRETGPDQLLEQLGVHGLVVPEAVAREHAQLLAGRGWRPVARVATCLVLHRGSAAFEPFFSVAEASKVPSHRDVYAAILGRTTSRLPVTLFTPGTHRIERYGMRTIEKMQESRNQTSFVVRGLGPKALVVFRRPWLPGWRATIDGESLPVLRAHLILPAVEIPADRQGEVRLTYRPASLVTGAWIALASLLILVGVSAWRVNR